MSTDLVELGKRIARDTGTRGATALAVWRHLVNTAGFVALTIVMGQATRVRFDADTMAIGIVSASVLLGMFLCRFAALTRLPLWVLSAQAPVQAVVALVASRISEGMPSALTILAVTMIVAGEIAVVRSRQPTR